MQFICEFIRRDHFKHSTRLDPQEDDAIEKIGRGDVGNFSSSKYLELGEPQKHDYILLFAHKNHKKDLHRKIALGFLLLLFISGLDHYIFKSPPLGLPLASSPRRR